MISEITIQNFKSVEDLTLPLGRVTVLIGENGSGKSNILEAIAFLGAAAANKLDTEFLVSRGIRVTDAALMRSAFPPRNVHPLSDANAIHLTARNGNSAAADFRLTPLPQKEGVPGWMSFPRRPEPDVSSSLLKTTPASEVEKVRKLVEDSLKGAVPERFNTKNDLVDDIVGQLLLAEKINQQNLEAEQRLGLGSFLIYSPENTALRRFEQEGQIQPIGIRGESLFKMLQTFGSKDNVPRLIELKHCLELTGWFLDFRIPENLAPGEFRLLIYDRFVGEKVTLDQRSANEGFLFLLFYFSLFLSPLTPHLFAIDNVDASLNPSLCAALMARLCELAAKYDKQVLVTTHNPALLDGLNLADSEQRLFAVSRNEDGKTAIRRIQPPKPREGEAPLKLSHAFLRGLIGGLPKNF